MKHSGVVVCAFVLAAGLLLGSDVNAGSLEPPGPPAPTMKTIGETEPRTPISSLPFTISAPGSYYLTRDLTGISGSIGIDIATSNVTLDLGGFSLIGVSGSLDGIRVTNGRMIVIRNGVVRGWGGSGISAATFPEITVEDLRARQNGGQGVHVGDRSVVRRTIALQNAGTAGIVTGPGAMIVESAGQANFNGAGIITGGQSTVTTSVATFNTTQGFQVSDNSVVTGCTAANNNVGFVLGSGSRVVDSTATFNVDGFSGNNGVSIADCTASSNTGDGIKVAGRGVVRGNVAYLNTGDGIEATGLENLLESNQSSQNGVGIRTVGTGNLVVRNSAVGNAGGEYVTAAGTKLGPIGTDPATTTSPWANFDL